MNDLGYFDHYGNIIVLISIILYLSLYTYLVEEYGPLDE
jgi:hypothetical protein